MPSSAREACGPCDPSSGAARSQKRYVVVALKQWYLSDMWVAGTHGELCGLRAAIASVVLPVILGSTQASTDKPPDTSRLYVFGALSKELLVSPDLETRELARTVELNAEPHKACVTRWFGLPEPDTYFGLWEPAGFAHSVVARCKAEGGLPLQVRPSGNDTSVFPKPVVVCLPPECHVDFIRGYWLPRLFLGRMELMPGRELSLRSLREALRGARVLVERLVEFPRADLPRPRLVIAGFPFSGTTSLVTELARHPQIAIPHHEDQIYWSFVYTPRGVDRWKKPYAREEARKRTAFPPNTSGPIILGLKDPFLALSTEGIKAVSRVPGAKVIVMLRDPMYIIQTWINHAADWINPFGDLMGYYVGLQYRDIFFNIMHVIAPENMLVVPTIALARKPLLVYKRIMSFLGLPEKRRRPFRVKQNKLSDSSSACAAIGRCFDFCKAPDGLPAAVHALLKMEATAGEALLRRQGWPEDVIDLTKPLPSRCPEWQTPPGTPAQWAEADPGVCYAMHFEPSECFGSREECARCCEQHQGGCSIYGPRFTECCVQLEKALINHLRTLTRQVLCGRNRTTRWPCNKGFGRHITAKVP